MTVLGVAPDLPMTLRWLMWGHLRVVILDSGVRRNDGLGLVPDLPMPLHWLMWGHLRAVILDSAPDRSPG